MSNFFKMSRKSASRVLIFVMFFALFAHVAGSISVAAADDEVFEADTFYTSSAYPSSSFPEGSFSHSIPYIFKSTDYTLTTFVYTFSSPVLLSSFVGSHLYIDASFSFDASTRPVVAFLSDDSFVGSSDTLNSVYTTSTDSDRITHTTISFSSLKHPSYDPSVSKVLISLIAIAPSGKGIISVTSDVPFVPVQPDPEPPTPATGEWQAFTQFIFGIFGTMGSIINNLLAAGGLSSIFFGFVFGIPIANFIIFLIEEIFDLEPYDPSSSWRREEHSLKELRPSDYNNFAGDPPSNRIGF